jgi:dTDP-4-dehydrorhamnose reductase
MKKIALIAPTGMLGSYVYKVLKEKNDLVLVYREEEKIKQLNEVYGGVDKFKKVKFDMMDIYQDYLNGFGTGAVGPYFKKLIEEIGEVDGIINCAGIIKPYSTKDPMVTMFMNSCLPHILSNYYREKLIHITTDCAYNGLEGAPYDESSSKTPNDLYGLSKSIGEPSSFSLVLRTSIVGPEIMGFVSLIEWFKKQNGQKIKGFTNHLWNGITTKQFGIICDQIVNNREKFPQNGLFHIFANDVTKYEMLLAFKKKYPIDVEIEPVEYSVAVDRRLRSKLGLCSQLNIPTFDQMINDL